MIKWAAFLFGFTFGTPLKPQSSSYFTASFLRRMRALSTNDEPRNATVSRASANEIQRLKLIETAVAAISSVEMIAKVNDNVFDMLFSPLIYFFAKRKYLSI